MGLSIDDLKFGYRDKKILEKIGFSSHHGEMLALLGPNGSGKTTLIKLLSKILNPERGVIKIEDVDIENISQKDLAKEMAVIPQSFDTSFSFTAHEIVMMGRTPYISRFGSEQKNDFDIVEKAMKRTDTWHMKDSLFFNLSGGEKQRIIIARALAQEPHVLLLDEPTSSLDINHQIEILTTVKSLVKEENMLVIAAFHDLNMAAKYFDRIVLLHKGVIYAQGRPEDVLTESNIREVYGVECVVKRNPITDSLYVLPITKKKYDESSKKPRIHIISGEGSGSGLMNRIDLDKYDLSLGVLNLYDSDQETAEYLKIKKVVLEAPFSPISYENHLENIKLVKESKVVIMSDFSVGSGNLLNLEAALIALKHNIPVLIYEKRKMEQKDFTNGEAAKLYNELIDNGALSFSSKKDLLDHCNIIMKKL